MTTETVTVPRTPTIRPAVGKRAPQINAGNLPGALARPGPLS
jgi:hypothetical protein